MIDNKDFKLSILYIIAEKKYTLVSEKAAVFLAKSWRTNLGFWRRELLYAISFLYYNGIFKSFP
jgi:hypothetical protein